MSENTTPATPTLPESWVAYIGPFATAIGKAVEEVTTSLKDLVGEAGDEAISLLKSREYTPDTDIGAAVGTGVPKAKLAKAIAGLREVVATQSEATVPTMSTASFDVLPQVPSDEAWLSALKVGGVLKFNKETVIGTVSAALAARLGLYDLPEKIGAAMERQAESLEEPVGEEYYTMQALLTRRNYADIFSAMPGVDGRFATQARKTALLRRINDRLWGSLNLYHQQLKQWVDAWQQSTAMTNPNALISALSSLTGRGGVMPPGLMQPPATDVLRDAADGVVNDINYVFAGTGMPVAMALAYDAQQIRKVLENPSLPAQLGVTNRDQMLRMLGVAVSSDYPRLERNLKQFALGIIDLPNVSAGEAEYQYIGALFQLGAMIPWDRLDTGATPGRGVGIGKSSAGRL